jgi:hypothetical protein
VCAAVLASLAAGFGRLPVEHQRRVEDLCLRSLSALGEHVLTDELDRALSALVTTLGAWGRCETAVAVQQARDDLARSIGRLGARSSRVPRG